MGHPKCKLCGHKHAGVDHVWPVVTVTKTAPTVTNSVTNPVTCNHCLAKDAEIERLRNQLVGMGVTPPKRDRAGYMREYRARAIA